MLNVKGEMNLNGNINVFKNILILMIAVCVTMFVQSIVATGPPVKNEVCAYICYKYYSRINGCTFNDKILYLLLLLNSFGVFFKFGTSGPL